MFANIVSSDYYGSDQKDLFPQCVRLRELAKQIFDSEKVEVGITDRVSYQDGALLMTIDY